MTFYGSKIKEQNVVFGILIVRPYVLQNSVEREKAEVFGKRAFGMIPIVLLAKNPNGSLRYYGRPDIVRFLAKISIDRLPLKKYQIVA